MKTPLALLGAVLCMAGTSHAILWTGTITSTLPDYDGPLYDEDGAFLDDVDFIYKVFPPGYSFTAVYQYESDTIDGEFNYFSGNARVDGILWDADGIWESSISDWDPLGWGILDSPQIVVEGGKVVRYDYFYGPFYTVHFELGGASYWDFDSFGGAEIFISDPVRADVPDSGSTLPLFALALIGFALRARAS